MNGFLKRFFSFIIFGIILFLLFFYQKKFLGDVLFLLLSLIIFFKGTNEFNYFFLRGKNIRIHHKIIVHVLSVLLIPIFIVGINNNKTLFEIISLFLLLIFIVFMFETLFYVKEGKSLPELFFLYTPLFFLVIPLSFLMALYFESGVKSALFVILVTKSGDIGGYVFGSISNWIMRGNHKMVPLISPNKSWEGLLGGLFTSIITAYSMILFYGSDWKHENFVVLGCILFFGGVLGDLFESSLKRMTFVKDSGAFIPGIGGVLDIVDSLLINAPLFYFISFKYKLI
jgi:phosphatidate cytidylyltransferase